MGYGYICKIIRKINVIENMSKILMAVMLLLSLHTFAETKVSMDLMVGYQNHKVWKTLDYEYYTFDVPSEWVLRFGNEDKISIHKRNIRFPNDKDEVVEYELGTLVWGTEARNMEEFKRIVDVERLRGGVLATHRPAVLVELLQSGNHTLGVAGKIDG